MVRGRTYLFRLPNRLEDYQAAEKVAIGQHHQNEPCLSHGSRAANVAATIEGAIANFRFFSEVGEILHLESERHADPSEAVIDSQSVKTAAGVDESVGYDAGKQIKGRKRLISVDTLVR